VSARRVRKRRHLWGLIGAALLVPAPLPVRADTSTALDQFLENLQSLRASFSQVVVDAKGHELESGQGTLLVRRPGRFRWEYTPAGAGPQLLVADGTNLWFYDRDLQQATVKPAAAALTTTPVILLSGSASEMRAAFTITDQGTRDELAWVQVVPRSAAAEFSSAELGFRGNQLLRLVIHDRLNQTDTLNFTRSARGARIEDSELHFTPPAGVDLIGTPQLGSVP
jgi:outer membrane lipoprotein carrier protein